MAWLKLTQSSDGPIYVNMDNVVEMYPYGDSTILMLVVAKGDDAKRISVKESLESIVGRLRTSGEAVN